MPEQHEPAQEKEWRDDPGGIETPADPPDLRVIFNAASTIEPLFVIDNPPADPFVDVAENPAIIWATDQFQKTAVITDTHVNTILDKIDPDNSVRDFIHSKGGDEDPTPEQRDALLKFNRDFIQGLRIVDPDLPAYIENTIRLRSGNMPFIEDLMRARLVGAHIENYHSTAYYPFKSWNINMNASLKEIVLGEKPVLVSEEHPEIHVLRIPDEQFDPAKFFKSKLENFEKDMGDINPMPGTPQEWALLIAHHEAEHMADDHQSTISQYFNDVAEMVGHNEDAPSLGTNLHHAMEIEGDMSAFNALYGTVAPEVLEYWAAMRIGSCEQEHIEHAWNGLGREIDHNDLWVPEEHDTGFFVNHYLETGEMPDYYETVTNINSFYQKSAEFYADKRGYTLMQDDKTGYMPPEKPTTPQLLDTVRQALMADPPVYSPAEEQIAQAYMDRIGDTLGVKAEPVGKPVCPAPETAPDMDNTPAPNPACEPAAKPQPMLGV